MKRHVLCALAFFALTGQVLAQEAPTPHKSPRTPVHREALQERKNAPPPSREVRGQAIIIDGEKLRVGDLDLRLFGIVPPQLSASFGPQARSALDELTAAQNVICLIRDRDHEGRFLATCHNAGNADLALELLRRGLAVAARGSVAATELAMAYISAEQAAGTQKAGLWSVMVPPPAVLPEPVKTAATSTQAEEESSSKSIEETPVPPVKPEQNQAKSAVEVPVKAAAAVAGEPSLAASAPLASSSEPGFMARYQLLMTALVMLATACSIFGAFALQRSRDKRAEMQATAAALRGELIAARAVCLARIRSVPEEKDIATWPRLRSTLYQAYVGRLGWLGADLARRIASIYGQASDYAAYYEAGSGARTFTLPKRQALQALVQHIDEVLPRLAGIEQTGNPARARPAPPRPVTIAMPLPARIALPPGNNPPVSEPPPAAEAPEVSESLEAAEMMPETTSSAPATPSAPPQGQFWTVVRKLVAPWGEKKAPVANDPIAEYTALIEEEMKRFSFTESEDEAELPADASGSWPSKAHGSF